MEPGLVLEGHLQMHVFRSAHLGIGHPDFLANTYSRPTRVAHRDDLVAQPNPAASIAYLPGEGISTRQRTGEPARPEPTSLTVPAADSTGATPGLGSSKAARLGAILALQAMTPPAAIAGSGFTLKVTQYTPLTNAGAAPARWSAAGAAHAAADAKSASSRIRGICARFMRSSAISSSES